MKSELERRKAIYPGTFDPITNGHLDLIKRAAALFDEVIVLVSTNIHKEPMFSLDERRLLVEKSIEKLENVFVDVFDGLLVHYAHQKGAKAIIRGLRAVSDFEYEFQMALMNRKLMPKLETVFLMPSEEYTYVNSSIVKEIAALGGRIDCFLPEHVARALLKKVKKD